MCAKRCSGGMARHRRFAEAASFACASESGARRAAFILAICRDNFPGSLAQRCRFASARPGRGLPFGHPTFRGPFAGLVGEVVFPILTLNRSLSHSRERFKVFWLAP
jgi:hypothetical protein